jgi:hypothetical protein
VSLERVPALGPAGDGFAVGRWSGAVAVGPAAIYLLVGAAVVLWGILLLARWPTPAFPTDDAYITLHNAATMIRGYDPNYQGVPALAGATSSVHLAVVAFLGLFLKLPLASFLASIAAAVLYALGLVRLARQFAPALDRTVLIVGMGLLGAYVPFHLFNGLETGLALAGGTWALALAGERSRVLLPLLCGVLPFIRPEYAALSAALLLRDGYVAWAERRELGPALTRVVSSGALALGAAAPWIAWLWISTGHPVPLTIGAKRAFFASDTAALPAAATVMVCLAQSGMLVGLGLLLVARRAALAVPALAFAAAFVVAYAAVFPDGLAHNSFRYTYALLPISIYALCSLAFERWLLYPLAALCLAAFPLHWSAYEHAMREFTPELAAVAQWANGNLPSQARVLIHDAGYIAFASDLHLVDMVGLKTPSSIEDHRRSTVPSAGAKRDEAIHRIAMRSGATHAIILADGGFWSGLGDDLRRKGWCLTAVRLPAVRLGYAVYELTAPASAREPELPQR